MGKDVLMTVNNHSCDIRQYLRPWRKGADLVHGACIPDGLKL